MRPIDVMWVCLGGGAGSLLRWQLGGFIDRAIPARFKFGTFLVNVTGAFVIAFLSAAQGVIVVARIALKEVLVIELEGLESLAPHEILRASFELGHGLGNQHWPAVIKGSTVYVPLSVDQKVMASVMRTHAFAHVKTRFAPGAEVAAQLDAKEVRLLFAGADATPHHHHGGHEAAQAQDHQDPHDHQDHPDHAHDHGHPHTHHHHHDPVA